MLFSESELECLRRGEAKTPEPGTSDLHRFAVTGKPLWLFGAGGFGRAIAKQLIALGGRVVGFLDNDSNLWGGLRLVGDGTPLPVRDPESFAAEADAVVILAVSTADAQEEVLAQCGRLDIAPETFIPPVVPKADAVDNPLVEEAYHLWDDRRSRDIYRLLVRKRTGLDAGIPMPFEPDQYFQPFITREYYRSFLDVGALSGDTFRRFLARFGNDWDNYYAVEPNPNSIGQFHPGRDEWPRLKLFNVAAVDPKRVGERRMRNSHSTSRMADDGELTVTADTLDAILGDSPVSFIKTDVEGWDGVALRGAKKLIAVQKPALAISVYHRFPHVWQIPLFIKHLDPRYRLHLRHHSRYMPETICYAHIPKPL